MALYNRYAAIASTMLTASSAVGQITTVDEAKQFYPLFGLGANVALIFSGRAVVYFSQVSR